MYIVLPMLDFLNDYNGLLMVLLTVYLVIFGRRNIKLLELFESERKKPSVIFDIVTNGNIIHVIVKNIGLSPALKIKISITPSLHSEGEIPGLINNEISFLSPGRELRDFVGTGSSFLQNKSDSDLVFEIFIEYEDLLGMHYKDNYIIDFTIFKKIGPIKFNGLHEINKNIEDVSKNLINLNKTIQGARQGQD